MPFCPVCRIEYRSGFTYCPDCDETLVESLEPLPVMPVRYIDDSEAVLLCTHTDEFKADMIVTALQNRGIPVLIIINEEERDENVTEEFSIKTNEIYVPLYLDDDAHEVLSGIVSDASDAPEVSSSNTPPNSDELYCQNEKNPYESYKPVEDKRIKLSVIFGIISVVYVIILYLTVG